MKCQYLKTLSLVSFGPGKKSVTQFGVLSGRVLGLRQQGAAFYEDLDLKALNHFELNCSETSLHTKCEFLDFVLLW